jgi:hypothetical protein
MQLLDHVSIASRISRRRLRAVRAGCKVDDYGAQPKAPGETYLAVLASGAAALDDLRARSRWQPAGSGVPC